MIERQDGPLLWGTVRPEAADAMQIYRQWNPHADAAGQLVEVKIIIRPVEEIPLS